MSIAYKYDFILIKMIFGLLCLLFIYNRYLNISSNLSISEYIPIRSIPSYPILLEDMLTLQQVNNTVFITVTTFGYKEFTSNFYHISNLHMYNNFFVVVHDLHTYRVKGNQ